MMLRRNDRLIVVPLVSLIHVALSLYLFEPIVSQNFNAIFISKKVYHLFFFDQFISFIFPLYRFQSLVRFMGNEIW